MRHLVLFLPGVHVRVDDPTPTPISGMKEVDMHLSFGQDEQVLQFYVTDDGRHVINISQGGVYDINQNPFQKDLEKLNTRNAPTFGRSGAPISLVMFSDFECPQCKIEAESLRKNLLVSFPTQVRVYFKDFPLESLHPWAKAAAATGRCVLEQGRDRFWDYHDWVYTNQNDIKPDNFRYKIDDFARAEKLDAIRFGHYMDNPATEGAEVDHEIAEGKALHINEKPTIFVNGRRLVGSLTWDSLKAVIEADLEYESALAARSAGKTATPSALDGTNR
jgi:protein-disulfide isomerase